MALKIYDTIVPKGDYPAVNAKDVEMPDGSRLSELSEIFFEVTADGVLSLKKQWTNQTVINVWKFFASFFQERRECFFMLALRISRCPSSGSHMGGRTSLVQ